MASRMYTTGCAGVRALSPELHSQSVEQITVLLRGAWEVITLPNGLVQVTFVLDPEDFDDLCAWGASHEDVEEDDPLEDNADREITDGREWAPLVELQLPVRDINADLTGQPIEPFSIERTIGQSLAEVLAVEPGALLPDNIVLPLASLMLADVVAEHGSSGIEERIDPVSDRGGVMAGVA